MSLRKILRQSRMLFQHVMHASRASDLSGGFERSLEISRLEDRMLFSASPMAPIVAEMADAGTGTSVESVSSPQDSGAPFQIADEQFLDLVGDSLLPSQTDNQDSSGAADAEATTLELVFLDSSVSNLDQLMSDLRADSAGDPSRSLEFILLDSQKDGIAQITSALLQYNQVDGLHIVSQGESGRVQLGSTTLSLDNLDSYHTAISAWQYSLSDEADILFYGCDLGTSSEGQQLLNQISILTNCDAASGDTSERVEIVFVDTGIHDYQQILADVQSRVAEGTVFNIVQIDADHDGLEQITRYLAENSQPVDAIHLIAHGTDRAFKLGNTWIDSNGLQQKQSEFQQWSRVLRGDADILFYGCNLASGENGRQMLEQISQWTGADVAASLTLIGAESLGGNWLLEYNIGEIETQIVVSAAMQTEWEGLLATFTVTNTNDSGAGSLRQAILDANALAGHDTIQFAIAGTGVHTINVGSSLTITDAVTIDATTDDSFAANSNRPAIILDGNNSFTGDGFVLTSTADGTTIRGFVIRDFSGDGIEIQAGSDGNTIAGNYIGRLTTTGTDAGVGEVNTGVGIRILGANNTIGGTTLADRNVISGNAAQGVLISGSSAFSNIIAGNYIGTDATGLADLGNTSYGVRVESGAINNLIGGSTSDSRNIIAGNDAAAVWIDGEASDGNIIRNNWIGLGADGSTVIGNEGNGIRIAWGADNTLIGGIGMGNVIVGGTSHGINITDASTGTMILGNFIGTDATGTVLGGHQGHGIRFSNSGSSTTIGGTTVGEGNVITGSGLGGVDTAGIRLGGTGTEISILGNSIYGNAGLGIDLGTSGVNANDTLDGDTGTNNLQNYPVITSALTNNIQITINGTINSNANSYYRAEFFANTANDGSGYGEGQRYLGFANVATDGSGNGTLNAVLTAFVSAGEFISATATRSDSGYANFTDTSEFAQSYAATASNTAPTLDNTGTMSLTTITEDQIINSGNTISSIIASAGGDRITDVDFGAAEGIAITALTSGNGSWQYSVNGGSSWLAVGTVNETSALLLRSTDLLRFVPNGQTGTTGDITFRAWDQTGATAGQQGTKVNVSTNGGATPFSSATEVASITVTAVPDVPQANDDDGHVIFDGIDDVVVIADAASLNMTNTMTMEAWINPTATANATRMIINKEGEYEVAVLNNTLQWAFANTNPGWTWVNTGYVISNNVWTHIAVSYDNGNIQTYVNGNLVHSYAGSGPIGDSHPTLEELCIGGRLSNPSTQYYAGAIDDVRIWNVARTQGEIQASLDQTLVGNETGLVGYYRFNEASGTTTTDLSSFGNHGVLTGGVTRVNYLTDQDTALAVSAADGVLANDRDGDGDPLTVTALNGNGAAIGSATTITSGALVTLNSDGSFTYNANGAFDYLAAGASATDSFTYTVSDGTGNTSTSTVEVYITGINDAPVQASIEGSALSYTENDGAVAITSTLAVSDVDDTNIDSAVVAISGNYVNGQDVLAFVNQSGITGSWNSTAGELTLTGSATLAQYQTALRSVTYTNTSESPSTATRTVSFTVNDGDANSNPQTRDIAITAVNDQPTFGVGNGAVTTPIGTGTDIAYAVATQPDGRFLLAGSARIGTNDDFAITRYNIDGTLDTTFGSGGIVTTDFSAGHDWAHGVVVQSDGKIVVVGRSHNGSNYDVAVARYNSDGTLDTSFGGGDGLVTIAIGSGTDVGNMVALQGDGKIVVSARASNGSNDDFAVVRLNTDGSLDSSFGGSGVVTTPIGIGHESGQRLTIQADGKIVVAGRSQIGGNYDFAVVRYNTDGTLDTSFGGTGIVTTAIGSGDDYGSGVDIQSDGKIVVGGYSHNGTDNDFSVVRYNVDGTLDVTFGSGGIVITPIGTGNETSHGLQIQPDGKIVVVGQSRIGSTDDFAVVRYNSDGSLDTTFNGTGMQTIPVGSGNDAALEMALQADGSILLAGSSHNGSNNDFAVVRVNSDGTVDTQFGPHLLNGSPTFIEKGPAVVLDKDVQIFDAELSALNNFANASLTLVRQGGASVEDVYSASGLLTALVEGGNLVYNGIHAGTVVTNSGGTLVLLFNNTASNALVNSVMQSIAYSNSSSNPPDEVQIDWTFSDGNAGDQGAGGALTAIGSTTVNITAVNDAPIAIDDPAAFSPQVLANQPVGYWRLGESSGTTAANLGTLGTNGTYNGSPTLGAAGALSGDVNTAVNFDGVNDNVNLGTFDVNGTGITMAAWINIDDFDNDDQRIISKALSTGTNQAQDHWWMLSTQQSGSDYVLRFRLKAGGTTDTLVASSGALSTGQWYHVASTYDAATGQMAIFLNGVLVGSQTHSVGGAVSTDATRTVMIGANPNGYGHFDGRIDEVAVYDKALSQSQLQAMFNAAAGGYSVMEDGTLSVNAAQGVLANDSDVENDPLTAVLVTGPANATSFTLNADGSFSYTPNADFNGTDSFTYRAFDGTDDSNLATVTINVTAVNDAPVQASIEGAPLAYTENDGPVAITSTIAISDVDDTHIESAVVAIAGNYVNGQDVLAFTNQNGITGVWNATTGELTLTGSATLAQYETALRSITYTNTSDNPSAATRTVSFTVNDGDANSNTQTRDIAIAPVNDAPVQASIEGTPLAYTENDGPVAITSTIAISDVDDTNIESAVVSISGNYVNGQDLLTFTNQSGITGVWNATTGTLTLTGSATLAQYETALRSITYTNTSDNPSAATRTVSFTVNDGDANSNTQTRDIAITPVNDAPVQASIEATPLAYTENDGPVAITSTIAISDLDDTHIESAVVSMSVNYVNGEDVLAFTNQSGITGVWNATTGTLTLTGSATLAQYETALRSITYANTSDNPSTATRTVSFTVNDGDANSNTQTRDIAITPVNDAPVISVELGDSAGDTVVETNAGLTTAGTLSVEDVDLADTVAASVTTVTTGGTTIGLISDNAAMLAMLSVNSDVIDNLSTTGTITWSFNSGSEAFDYLAVGESLTLTYTVQVTDSQGATDTQAVTINVAGTNDVPLISVEVGDSAGETLSVTGASLTSIGTLSVADLDRTDTVTAAITGFSRLGDDTGLTLSNAQLEALLSLNAGVIDGTTQAGMINWAFDSAGYTFDYLGSGQSLTLIYTVTVTDSQGATDTQDITIVINGDNSAPVISVEAVDSAADTLVETNTTLATTGSLSVTDINTTDLVTANVATVIASGTTTGLQSNNAALLAMLAVNANVIDGTTETGTINWSFNSGSEAFDYLAVGESLTLTYTVRAEDSQGAFDTQEITITIIGTNDAATITSGYTHNLVGTDENTPSLGTLASEILAGASWADADNGAVSGLSITGMTGNGTWQYSTDGMAWTDFGAVSEANALLITSSTQVRYIPDGLNGETAMFTFRAWDQTSGTASTNATAQYSDTTSNGGTTAFSANAASAAVVVAAVNDAPVFNDLNGNPTFTENGLPVVLDSDVTIFDAELSTANNFAGATLTLARSGLANNQDDFSATGTLSFSGSDVIVGGTNIGTLVNDNGILTITFNSNATNALVNEAIQQIAYSNISPNPPASVQIDWTFNDGNAGDQGSGGALYATGSVIVDIIPVNDPPELDSVSLIIVRGQTMTLNEGNFVVLDPDSTSFTYTVSGITAGYFQLSTAPGTPITSFTSAQLDAGLVEFVHNGSETAPQFTATVNDGEFNSDPTAATIYFTTNNTAPTLNNLAAPVLNPVLEDAGAPVGAVGTLISSLVDFASVPGGLDNVTDPDTGAQLGIAVVGANSANGTWWFTTDNGTTWQLLGAVSESNARLLAANANTRLYFQANPNWNGEIADAISFRAWDRTTGVNGGVADLVTPIFTNENVRDGFSTASYGNNNGTNTWSSNWIENDVGGGGPTGGLIRVASGQLRIQASGNAGDWIYRQADLSAAIAATLSFSFNNQFDGGNNQVVVEISSNGGGSYTQLVSFTSSANQGIGTRSYNITEHISENTRVRFRVVDASGDNRFIYFDNIEVAYTASYSPTGGKMAFSTATDTAALNVVAVNDAPVFSNLDGNPNYTEGGSPVVLDNNVTLFDVELNAANNFSGSTLTLVRNGGASSQDQFSATGTLGALVEGGSLVVGSTTIGTVTINSGGQLVLTFNKKQPTHLSTRPCSRSLTAT